MESKENYLFIENYWSVFWLKNKSVCKFLKKKSYFILDMFPYPSNKGLHVGHPAGYIISDVLHKYFRGEGRDSLRIMGWDSFGLPTEQYSIATKTHPAISTKTNVGNFKNQLNKCALFFDWSKSFKTTDKSFYKWTQRIFLLLLQKGYCHSKSSPILWCPKLNTVLSDEEVDKGGLSERGNHPTSYKFLNQWVLRLKNYSLSYVQNLNFLNWPFKTKSMQNKWVGVYRGSCIYAAVCTKRHFVRLSLDRKWLFAAFFIKKFEVSSFFFNKLCAVVPVRRARLFLQNIKLNLNRSVLFPLPYTEPVCFLKNKYLAVNVLGNSKLSGSMHPKLHCFKSVFVGKSPLLLNSKMLTQGYVLINGGQYDCATTTILKCNYWKYLSSKSSYKVNVKNWVFSRQRYWGEPFPVIWVSEVTYKSVLFFMIRSRNIFYSGSDKPIWKGYGASLLVCLPLLLKNLPYKIKPFEGRNTPTPRRFDIRKGFFKKSFRKKFLVLTKLGFTVSCFDELNVMPQWAGSSWYYLKYMDSLSKGGFLPKGGLKKWKGPDIYIGGSEHAVLHLLYSRFWNFVLHEQKKVFFKEPFKFLKHQGLILNKSFTYKGGLALPQASLNTLGFYNFTRTNLKRKVNLTFKKMSKSFGRSLNPLKITGVFGLDSFRVYEMLNKPVHESKVWDTKSLARVYFSMKNLYYFVIKNRPFVIKSSLVFVRKELEIINIHSVLDLLIHNIFSTYEIDTILKFVKMTFLYMPSISEEVWLRLGFVKGLSLSYSSNPKKLQPTTLLKNRLIINLNSIYTNTLYFKNINTSAFVHKSRCIYIFKVKCVCVYASSRNRTNNINLED